MSRTVPLTKGYVATVDDADYPLVALFSWCAKTGDGKVYAVHSWWDGEKHHQTRMHRLLMNAPKGVEVDHRDGDGLNNTRGNLRLATRTQNARNKRPQANKASRFKGVYRSSGSKWRARIRVGGKIRNLGQFASEADAARAYDGAAHAAFGEFAWLNFPKAA